MGDVVAPRWRAARHAWTVGLTLRLLAAVGGTGYVHPDEHFQSVEVAARVVLNMTTFTPWEFGGDSDGLPVPTQDFQPFV